MMLSPFWLPTFVDLCDTSFVSILSLCSPRCTIQQLAICTIVTTCACARTTPLRTWGKFVYPGAIREWCIMTCTGMAWRIIIVVIIAVRLYHIALGRHLAYLHLLLLLPLSFWFRLPMNISSRQFFLTFDELAAESAALPCDALFDQHTCDLSKHK